MARKINLGSREVIFTIILVIQLIVLLYWGNQKSNFYWDEYYTFDNAHYVSESTPSRVNIEFNSDLERNTWVDVSVLQDTYVVTKENSIINDGWLNIINKLFTYKPYMVILNVVETYFFTNEMSKWSGISLNIIFFVIIQIFLYKLAKKIMDNSFMALVCTTLYGFCGMTISMTEFVRFYMFVTMTVMVSLYLHWNMWGCQIWYKNIIMEMISVILIYLGFLNSPLVVAYGLGLVVCFSVALFIRKRYKQFIYYAAPIVSAGFLYLWNFTDFIQAFFEPDKYSDIHGTGAEYYLLMKFNTLSLEEVKIRIITIADIICRLMFGNKWIGTVCFIMVIFLLVMLFIKRRSIRNVVFSDRLVFFIIMLGIDVFYLIFSVCYGLEQTRYYSFMFPVIIIVFVALVYGISKIVNKEQALSLCLVAIVMVSSLLTLCTPSIDNIYREDKAILETVSNESNTDVVVIAGMPTLQECIAWSNNNSKIYIADVNTLDYSNFPNEFLLWNSQELEESEIGSLSNAKYRVSELGQTYVSYIYKCTK